MIRKSSVSPVLQFSYTTQTHYSFICNGFFTRDSNDMRAQQNTS